MRSWEGGRGGTLVSASLEGGELTRVQEARAAQAVYGGRVVS